MRLRVGERARERVEQTDTLLVLKASGFQISLFLRLPLNQCGQECCSAPQYVSPFRTFAPSSTSSVHLSETPEGNPVQTHYRFSLLLLSLCSPSSFLPPPLSLSPFPPSVFLLHDLTFPIPPPSVSPSSFYNLRYRTASEHRLVNYTGLSVGKQACASSCKTETCWQASVTHVIQAADQKMIVQYAGWGRL